MQIEPNTQRRIAAIHDQWQEGLMTDAEALMAITFEHPVMPNEMLEIINDMFKRGLKE